MKSALSAFALAARCCGAAQAADCKVGVAMYTQSATYFAAQVAATVYEAKKAECEVSQSDGKKDMNKPFLERLTGPAVCSLRTG